MANFSTITIAAFLMGCSLVLLVFLLLGDRQSRLKSRLRSLSGQEDDDPDRTSLGRLATTTLPKVGTPLVPTDDEERTKLQNRLIHAGLYRREAMVIFLGVKVVLMFAPALLGIAISLTRLVTFQEGLLLGACLGIGGLIGPSFWLDYMKNNRQNNFRRALPDGLDVLVICLEGGLSMPAAIKRVSNELRLAHPLLASELAIVQREIQLGRTAGEALRKMGERTDIEEMRSLAAVIIQSERFGASLVKSLRIYADSLRQKRQQRAEELAQTAATKMLFPTILFVFPAMFVVILGPAAIHIIRIFSRMGF